jgi:predicted nucleotidyltransferase
VIDRALEILRQAGARFVFLHGSRAERRATSRSDLDLAAHFAGRAIDLPALVAALPPGCDLLVLDQAPLELAGRVALRGRLLFEVDPAERVEWQATTRKIYLDELPRLQQAAADFKAGAIARGRR